MEAQRITGALVGSLRRSDPDEANLDEVDRLITRRASEPTARERANAEEESWKASTRAYNAEHREPHRHLWVTHYLTLARNLRASADRFEEKADALRVL